jgi:hypothetical protein
MSLETHISNPSKKDADTLISAVANSVHGYPALRFRCIFLRKAPLTDILLSVHGYSILRSRMLHSPFPLHLLMERTALGYPVLRFRCIFLRNVPLSDTPFLCCLSCTNNRDPSDEYLKISVYLRRISISQSYKTKTYQNLSCLRNV